MAAALLAAAAIGGTASARSIPAFSGRPLNGNQTNCFNMNFNNGWVTNNFQPSCGTVVYEIPLHADSNGTKSVNMTVNAPDTFSTDCRLVGISRTGTNMTATNFIHPSVTNTPVAIILNTPTVTQINMGMIFVDCDVGAGASLIQVDWNN